MPRAPTGIAGIDEITRGGLPTGRVTLVEGGPGAGKTLLALQTLVHGAMAKGEAGIFVAFEEAPRQILANAANFAFASAAPWQGMLFFLDGQPNPDLVQSGSFDLSGLLAVVGAKAAEMGATRIVFDAIDVVLALLPDAEARRRELHRLHQWLLKRGITAVITAKAGNQEVAPPDPEALNFMQFMVDCAIALRHEVIGGVSQRSLRVLKYRGSGFDENPAPLLIGSNGIEVASVARSLVAAGEVSAERISTGITRLDAMLDGGYHRGASILLSGAPGTAKSTLCGAFADAACRRGEPTLFVNFDSPAAELIRNIGSVGIDLARHVASGLLRCHATRSLSASAEVHMMQIRAMTLEHGARCVIVDPLSALSPKLGDRTSHNFGERLIDWAKSSGVTLLCTSLLGSASPETEGTLMQVSTIADTWIHLSYMVQSGERNRALTIIKSRGTGHSNQVRELLLSDTGITLDDVYLAGGKVLMGTLRWAMEKDEALREAEAGTAAELQRLRLQSEAAHIEGRIARLRSDLEMKSAEYAALLQADSINRTEAARTRGELRRRRRADRPSRDSDNV